jgi:hypothetical protein
MAKILPKFEERHKCTNLRNSTTQLGQKHILIILLKDKDRTLKTAEEK